MKTILISSLAASGLMLASASAGASDSRSIAGEDSNSGHKRIENSGGNGHHARPEYSPAIRPDAQVYDWGDEGNVAFKAPDGSSYSYDGEWEGEFVDPQGRVFEGEWEGTVTRHNGAPHPMSPPDHPHPKKAGAPYPPTAAYGSGDERSYVYNEENYRIPREYEPYERCLKSNGLKGAAIGAILGGFAGNRIAGRGDRLGGTILGAGVGGIAGAAIEKATDKCKRYEPRYGGHGRAPYPQGYPHGYPQTYSYGWQGGYYYYPQQVVTVVHGAPVTTTTVTEEIHYETVRTAPRKRTIRKWKPKPKPRCVC